MRGLLPAQSHTAGLKQHRDLSVTLRAQNSLGTAASRRGVTSSAGAAPRTLGSPDAGGEEPVVGSSGGHDDLIHPGENGPPVTSSQRPLPGNAGPTPPSISPVFSPSRLPFFPTLLLILLLSLCSPPSSSSSSFLLSPSNSLIFILPLSPHLTVFPRLLIPVFLTMSWSTLQNLNPGSSACPVRACFLTC